MSSHCVDSECNYLDHQEEKALLLDFILGKFSKDLAIDLGTANTLMYIRGKGIVLNEPSVVAVHLNSKGETEILALGSEAKRMLGRTPGNIAAIRPMRDGVIADFSLTEAMLRHFIKSVQDRCALIRPRIIVSIPFGITQVEKRVVRETVKSAGAREVYLIEEPMAAAIGAGLPITEPISSMVVDIGGGTTECAVISLNGIVYSQSIRVAGDKIDEEIIQYMKRKYNLLIGEGSVESIKMELGNAYPDADGETRRMESRGRDMISGIPKVVEINSDEIRETIMGPLATIVAAIKDTLRNTPAELAGDITSRGIILTGGGALIRNIDVLIRMETGLPVTIAEDPLSTVARGAGVALEQVDILKDVAF